MGNGIQTRNTKPQHHNVIRPITITSRHDVAFRTPSQEIN